LAPTPRRRGFGAERELARLLWRHGFAVVRGPASGARTKHVIYPDLVALYKGHIYVFEVKYRSSPSIYISSEQVGRLREFAERAGAEPLIAVKIPRRGWYVVRLSEAKRTRNGIKIDEDVISTALTLEAFVRSVVNEKLESYIEAGGQPGKLSSPKDCETSGRE